jgi:hypothetical protein
MATAEDLDHATDSQWDWVAEHTRKYLASGGTEGHESNGVLNLVLATTGRRTGTPRRTCLIYGAAGGEYVVVASKAAPRRTRPGSTTWWPTLPSGCRSAPAGSPPAPG